MKGVRILIADDHDAVRRGLRSLLESHVKWQICGEARNGLEAIEKTRTLKPDVALLDMTMPGLNGLEVTREILRLEPQTCVLLLTTHQSPELSEEVRRAGARAVLSKSDAQAVMAAIESFQGNGETVHLAGGVVGTSRHIGAFFRSNEERYAIVAQFTRDAIAAREKIVHIIEPPGREVHVQRLKDAGVDFDGAAAENLIDLIPWDQMYLHGGHFDQHAMLERLEQQIRKTSQEGFRLGRLVANMEWVLESRPGVEDLVEYEARVNRVVPSFDDVVVCAYDIHQFPSDLLLNVLRSHPAVVIGGTLRDNSLYVPPDQLLDELRVPPAQ